jgi:SNF2 family DNA or RNA helicase
LRPANLCEAQPQQRQVTDFGFQAGVGDLFLLSLKAGGVGLNLTAADYLIHLDPWWNPAVEQQASDRAHRIGQTRPVTIYGLVLQGSIEEQILSLHGQKRELIDGMLSERKSPKTVGADELMALIGASGDGEAASAMPLTSPLATTKSANGAL